jgi:hypothetical protein
VQEAVVTPCPARWYAVHNCVDEGEHTVSLEVAPAGTYISCDEEGEYTVSLESAPAEKYINCV